MHLCVALEHRFRRTPDGAVWTRTMFPYSFWTRYLDVFSHVHVLTRVLDTAEPPQDWKRVDGEGVSCIAAPYFVGPAGYLRQASKLKRLLRQVASMPVAFILRVPSQQIAGMLQPLLLAAGRPYGVEVVADPHDVFAPGAVKHPLRPIFRRMYARQLKAQCAGACAAAYVTAEALQRRYPPASGAFTTHYSSVELPESALVAAPRSAIEPGKPLTLISVGTLEQLNKAPDVLIDAVGQCIRDGLVLRLIFVGDGRCRPELEARAVALNLGDRIRFAGSLPAGDAVRAALDDADLFVLPSRQEGLPRAMIEAMARALPCIGSTIGGIPELLPSAYLAPPGDAAALARIIRTVVTDPTQLARMSADNLQKAHDYRDDILRDRRIALYRAVEAASYGVRCEAPLST